MLMRGAWAFIKTHPIEMCAFQCMIPIFNVTSTATTNRKGKIQCWLNCQMSLVPKAAKNNPGSPGQPHPPHCGPVKR